MHVPIYNSLSLQTVVDLLGFSDSKTWHTSALFEPLNLFFSQEQVFMLTMIFLKPKKNALQFTIATLQRPVNICALHVHKFFA